MNTYRVLNKQNYYYNEYSLVPIRVQDRYKIMKWRNEQIYHLRQNEVLTPKKQDRYFEEVVADLFDNEKPDQILFSYLRNKECIGYGGLVHINWSDKNAELSFIIKSKIEYSNFRKHWDIYLKLIEEVAFMELGFHKIYTYAYDLRPQLYNILEDNGYFKEAALEEHACIDNEYVNVIIHSKIINKGEKCG